jgi:hypothetical protein
MFAWRLPKRSSWFERWCSLPLCRVVVLPL